MNISIRKTNSSDWEIIQELNNYVFLASKNQDDDLDMNWPFSETGIKYYKSAVSGKDYTCFIAADAHKPVGYVILTQKKYSYRKSKYIEIDNIGVIPEYRSKGIGKLLIDKTKEYAKSQHADRLFVSSYWLNKQGIKFYENNGFSPISIELEQKL